MGDEGGAVRSFHAELLPIDTVLEGGHVKVGGAGARLLIRCRLPSYSQGRYGLCHRRHRAPPQPPPPHPLPPLPPPPQHQRALLPLLPHRRPRRLALRLTPLKPAQLPPLVDLLPLQLPALLLKPALPLLPLPVQVLMRLRQALQLPPAFLLGQVHKPPRPHLYRRGVGFRRSPSQRLLQGLGPRV